MVFRDIPDSPLHERHQLMNDFSPKSYSSWKISLSFLSLFHNLFSILSSHPHSIRWGRSFPMKVSIMFNIHFQSGKKGSKYLNLMERMFQVSFSSLLLFSSIEITSHEEFTCQQSLHSYHSLFTFCVRSSFFSPFPFFYFPFTLIGMSMKWLPGWWRGWRQTSINHESWSWTSGK